MRKAASRNIYLPWERRRGISRRLGLGKLKPFLVGAIVLAIVVLLGLRERQRTRDPATRAAPLGLRRIVGAIVLAIVVLLGLRERQRTGDRATRAALLVVRRSVDAYRADHDGKCPKQLEELETTGYIRDLPDDAWGRPFKLVCPSRRDGV